MKSKIVKDEDLINWWLTKYHNTNLQKIKEKHPEWEKDPHKYSIEFYETYMVTEEQHDEWEEWAKEYVRKITHLPKALIDRGWWSIYLNVSPQIMKTEKENV